MVSIKINSKIPDECVGCAVLKLVEIAELYIALKEITNKLVEISYNYNKTVLDTWNNKTIKPKPKKFLSKEDEARDEELLAKFRKEIEYGDGTGVDVFVPGSYPAMTSKLGDGPHAKRQKAKSFRKELQEKISQVSQERLDYLNSKNWDGWMLKQQFDGYNGMAHLIKTKNEIYH